MKTVAALAVAGLAGMASAAAVESRDVKFSQTPLTPITVKGNAFFQGDKRFYVRGLDYQPGGSSGSPGADGVQDPLINKTSCERDAKYFKDLGLNAIRVYSVDNSQSHDDCMDILNTNGIYLILDVNTPKASLNRDQPMKSYNPTYLQSIFATMDAFAKYPNTMAFFSGNEVINDTQSSTLAAPYIKAVTRDMKSYLAGQNIRRVPIGYSAADIEKTRYETAEYLNCGTDDERSDFFAFNDYSWCGKDSSFQISGWDAKVKLFSNYSVPIFLSEFGCNTKDRSFTEVKSLYSKDMTGVYSGGLVYEYSQEPSNYGLGTIDGNTYTPNDNYTNLKNAFQGTPLPTDDGGYRQNPGKASNCPAGSDSWTVVKNNTLPATPDGAVKYFTQGAGKALGIGLQSMDAGGWSTTWAQAGSGKGAPAADNPNVTNAPSSSTSKAAAHLNVPEFSFAPLLLAGAWAAGSLLGGSFFLL